VRKWRWLRGARLTLEATNLFDVRQSVHDAAGATPLAYQPGYMNASGRVVELSVRKLFF
jgi:outer membrane receptor protein involved in Fe transport